MYQCHSQHNTFVIIIIIIIIITTITISRGYEDFSWGEIWGRRSVIASHSCTVTERLNLSSTLKHHLKADCFLSKLCLTTTYNFDSGPIVFLSSFIFLFSIFIYWFKFFYHLILYLPFLKKLHTPYYSVSFLDHPVCNTKRNVTFAKS